MKAIRWFNYRLYKFHKIAVVSIFLFMLGLSALQVILRLFFHGGIQNAETLLRYLVLWVAFLGASLATFKKRHINLEVVSKAIKASNKHLVELIISIISFITAAALCYSGVVFIINEFTDAATPVFHIPVWLLESIIPLTFFAMALIFLQDAISSASALMKKGAKK